jgi:ABC-2 type transport system permease protein
MDALRIYFKLIQISMKGRMQYRADFITGIISILLLNTIQLGLISILVSRFVHINGWGVWDLVLLYGMWMLGHSVYSLLFWHLNTMEDHLIRGTFDQFLVRPISPLVQFLGREIQYMGIGDIVVGVSCLTLAYTKLGLHWGGGEWVFLILAVVAGTMIEFSMSWIMACLAFWFGRSQTAFFVLVRLNLLTQQYPVDIFGGWFRVIVTGLLPVAFMNYYPSLVLLGKTDTIGELYWLAYMSPVVAILLVLLSSQIWRLAIRRYSSSGS